MSLFASLFKPRAAWAVILLVPTAWGAIQDANQPAVVDENTIQQAIRDLGDGKLAVREAASRLLWETGLAAEQALRVAAAGTDAETRYRAKAILEKFRFGILPNTSTDVLRAIDAFRNGDLKARVDAITLMASQGLHTQAEQLLQLEPAPDLLLSAYVTQLLLRGKLDERLTEVSQKVEVDLEPNRARIAAMMLRAKGERQAAQEMAARSQDLVFEWGLSMENGAYTRAAKLFEKIRALPQPNNNNNANPSDSLRKIEQAGYIAALQFRAGNQAASQAALDELQTLAKQNPAQAIYCAEPFFLAGNPEAGMEAMKAANPHAYFELLIYQQKYQEALAFLGVSFVQDLPADWFDSLPIPPNTMMPADAILTARFRLAGNTARILSSLERKKKRNRFWRKWRPKRIERCRTRTGPCWPSRNFEVACFRALSSMPPRPPCPPIAPQWSPRSSDPCVRRRPNCGGGISLQPIPTNPVRKLWQKFTRASVPPNASRVLSSWLRTSRCGFRAWMNPNGRLSCLP